MKNLNILLLTMTIILCAGRTLAQNTNNQNTDVTIHICDSSVWLFGSKFWIDIKRDAKSININYRIEDSIRWRALQKDTAFVKLKAKLDSYKVIDTNRKKLSDIGMRFVERYTAYHRDSVLLTINGHKAYNTLLTHIANASKEKLETVNPTRLMDADFIICTITTATGNTKEIWAEGLFKDPHPQMERLIKATMDLARDDKHPAVLMIHDKFGY